MEIQEEEQAWLEAEEFDMLMRLPDGGVSDSRMAVRALRRQATG